ncbi:MAG TPA: HD domain-containing phosphohydrolase, partial [Planctomycetota bacterium]|nr:HD domain-containing phosphohydrolase [Planctomycetota bacterium]
DCLEGYQNDWDRCLEVHAPGLSALLLCQPEALARGTELVKGGLAWGLFDLSEPRATLAQQLEEAARENQLRLRAGWESDPSAPMLHTQALEALYQLSLGLFECVTLQAMAELATASLQILLPERGVSVDLWDPRSPVERFRAQAGPDLGAELVRVPLDTSAGVAGELVVDVRSNETGRLGPRDIRTLYLVAAPLASATQNELHRRERERAQQGTLLAMAKVAEMRDNETGQHLQRVSQYAELIARGLREDGHYVDQITDAFIKDVVRCAPLHDLGKVAIPDAVLLKRGRLTPEEWALMKTHPEWGARLLREMVEENADLAFVSMGQEIAHFHHERWDGQGYPVGLQGEAIPLSARIVALADIYDALTTPRPYKLSWSVEAVREHLGNLSGNHLDPKIVASFLKRADAAVEIQRRLMDREPKRLPTHVDGAHPSSNGKAA